MILTVILGSLQCLELCYHKLRVLSVTVKSFVLRILWCLSRWLWHLVIKFKINDIFVRVFNWILSINSSVIRKKGKSQNGCFKKTKHVKFSEKRLFLTPWYPHVCVSGGKKCSFFGKFGLLCFLKTPVLRFALLPYYWRISGYIMRNSMKYEKRVLI